MKHLTISDMRDIRLMIEHYLSLGPKVQGLVSDYYIETYFNHYLRDLMGIDDKADNNNP